ncbi:MAG: WD40/YVTN/BNR-like repeat-containing protein, partial [Trebonia sp.]
MQVAGRGAPGNSRQGAVVRSPTVPYVYAATGSGLLKLIAAEDGFAGEKVLEGLGVQCVATSADDPNAVYCGCRGDGLHRSRDDGATFERLSLAEQDVFSVAVSRADGAVYAGCEPSRLYRSRDGGATWEELEALREIPSASTWSFPPRPWTSHVRWVAPSPHDADVLLVGIELGGVMRSA